jgi:predicted thioesterase
MKNSCTVGDTRHFERTVTEADLARFEAGLVHPLYSTFALARDAEWTCRLFVLDLLEAGEEGIGQAVSVTHHAPALLGETVRFEATLTELTGNKVVCSYTAHVGSRLIATGTQTQYVLDKARFAEKLHRLHTSAR